MPPRPQGAKVHLRRGAHGAWVIEIRYRGSTLRDVAGNRIIGGQDGYYNNRIIEDDLWQLRGEIEREFEGSFLSSLVAGVNYTNTFSGVAVKANVDVVGGNTKDSFQNANGTAAPTATTLPAGGSSSYPCSPV